MGSYSPWGPHGGTGNPHEVRPNPTPPYVPPAWDNTPSWTPAPTGGSYGAGGSSGAGYSGATYHAGWFVSGIIVAFLWTFWVALYPAAVAAAAAGMYGSWTLFTKFLPPAPGDAVSPLAVMLASVAGLVVLIVVSRLEHVLARFLVYRLLRHCLRLLTFAWLFLRYIPEQAGDPIFPSRGPFDLSFLSTTNGLAITAAVLVGTHFLLWNAKALRRFWHRRLQAVWLRGKNLPEAA